MYGDSHDESLFRIFQIVLEARRLDDAGFYRVASTSGGTLSLDLNAGNLVLGSLAVPATGGAQTWRTMSHTVTINAGAYDVGVYASKGGWHLNWLRFTKL